MPKTTADEAKKLARISPDCSFLLTHLVRENHSTSSQTSCAQILDAILDINGEGSGPYLKSSSLGWYSSSPGSKIYKPNTNNQFAEPIRLKGICFTESTLAGLKGHREIFKAKYGIAFDRDFLYSRGANPCLNIREDILKSTVESLSSYNHLYNYIPEPLTAFINIINDSFDAGHEREWRILNDFFFSYSDIKFIFCPENEFSRFSKTQTHGLPVLFDLAWLDRI